MSFSLFRLCETHYVNVYGGETDSLLEELCGFRANREVIEYDDGNHLVVEFRYVSETTIIHTYKLHPCNNNSI